jgi:hypothetical protein
LINVGTLESPPGVCHSVREHVFGSKIIAAVALIGLVSVAGTGCGGTKTGASCLGIGVPALAVAVVNQSESPVCTAVVTATDGAYSRRLMKVPSSSSRPCGYAGPYNRAGTYAIAVRADGISVRKEGVTVKKDSCNVITKAVRVTLKPRA